MSKPKLLLISGVSPFPQTSGGATRIKQTLFYLSEKYDIYFYFFINNQDSLEENDKLFLSKHTVSFRSINLFEKSLFTSFKNFIPYHLSNYFSRELIEEFKKLQLNTKFDQIRIESTQLLYLARYLSKNQLSKFVALDISTISFWRRAFDTNNPLKILIRLFSCLQVYLYEKSLLNSFSKIVVMSKKDDLFIKKLFALENTEVNQNGIEKINFLSPITDQKLKIGFIGSVGHTPNKKALDFLLLQILPTLKEAQIDCEIIVLGKSNRNFYQNSSGVKFIDYVDDLQSFYKQIDLLVAPIFSGSGTRLKILESLSYGKQVLTTVIGAEGINLKTPLLKIFSKSSEKNVTSWIKEIKSFASQKKVSNEDLEKLKNELKELTWKYIFKED